MAPTKPTADGKKRAKMSQNADSRRTDRIRKAHTRAYLRNKLNSLQVRQLIDEISDFTNNNAAHLSTLQYFIIKLCHSYLCVAIRDQIAYTINEIRGVKINLHFNHVALASNNQFFLITPIHRMLEIIESQEVHDFSRYGQNYPPLRNTVFLRYLNQSMAMAQQTNAIITLLYDLMD